MSQRRTNKNGDMQFFGFPVPLSDSRPRNPIQAKTVLKRHAPPRTATPLPRREKRDKGDLPDFRKTPNPQAAGRAIARRRSPPPAYASTAFTTSPATPVTRMSNP